MRYTPAEPNSQPASLFRQIIGIILLIILVWLFIRWYFVPTVTTPATTTQHISLPAHVTVVPPTHEPATPVTTTPAETSNIPEPPIDVTSPAQIAPASPLHTVMVKKGDNLALIFNRLGLSNRDLYEVMSSSKLTKPLKNLRTGQQLRIEIDPQNQRLLRLEVPTNAASVLVIRYEEGSYQAELQQQPLQQTTFYKTAVINGSFISTAKKAGVPVTIARQFVQVFGWVIDFNHDLHKGARFTLAYQAYSFEGKPIRYGNMIAATLTNRGKIHSAIRFRDQHQKYHYYTPKGNSLRQTLLRRPVLHSYISSPFNLHRKHPILGIVRPHKGTDFAAAYGTPIHATGDGRISFIGMDGGYGRVIKIRHSSRIGTVYAHMSRFATGMKKGKWVKQNQVIGYIGVSGLATGPHVHYEVRINGKPHDPMKVRLPKAAPLPRSRLVKFIPYAKEQLAKLHALEQPTKK